MLPPNSRQSSHTRRRREFQLHLKSLGGTLPSGSNLTFQSEARFPLRTGRVGVWRMRTGISITLKTAVLWRLARDRNAPA